MATMFTSADKAIDEMIKIFKDEEGYLEKKSNANLYSKTANAGYNNYTKYWKDINEWCHLNKDTNWAGGGNWYWCAAVVYWVFVKAFGVANAKKLLLHAPYISCQNLGTLGKKQLYNVPKKGDVILFFNGSRFYHTGVVYKTTSTRVYTIEGNTNATKAVVPNGGAVCLKNYAISSCKSKKHKFFRPDYSIVVDKKAPTVTSTTKEETKPSTTTKKYVTVNTKTDPLNCRSKANENSVAIGKFAKGSKLTLLEKTNSSWWKVSGKSTAEKTITGYCSTRYLKEVK